MKKRNILITLEEDVIRLLDLIGLTENRSRSALIREAINNWISINVSDTIKDTNNILSTNTRTNDDDHSDSESATKETRYIKETIGDDISGGRGDIQLKGNIAILEPTEDNKTKVMSDVNIGVFDSEPVSKDEIKVVNEEGNQEGRGYVGDTQSVIQVDVGTHTTEGGGDKELTDWDEFNIPIG